MFKSSGFGRNRSSADDDDFFGEKKHILAVDDDRTFLKLIRSVLEPKYKTTVIASGKMAEQFLEKETPDLILLDYEMPDVTGAVMFRNLKANPRTANIPVIFLTGVSDGERVKYILSYKPDGYLLKPISTDRLLAMIKKFIG